MLCRSIARIRFAVVLLFAVALSAPGVRSAAASSCNGLTAILQSENITQTTLTVTWDSEYVGVGVPVPCVGRILGHQIGTSTFWWSPAETAPTSHHVITLSGMDMSTQYEYQLYGDFEGDGEFCALSSWRSFWTADPPPPCVFTVTNVGTSATSSAFTVTWQSSPAATGRIQWKRYSWENWSPSPFTAFGTSHSRTATGLSAGVTYMYEVQMLCPATGVITTEASGTITTASGGGGGGKGPLPEQPAIKRLWPSPTSGQTHLLFVLPRAGRVVVDVFDLNGRRVAGVADRTYPAGEFSVEWTGQDASGKRVRAGVYFMRMRADGVERTARVLVSSHP